ncbi:sialate O-acetylesterase [Taibaiella soli]|uniref:Sialate O-acetylesterase n=1 Tax=Taibaiella soli TaxID=1649169 RepID=A0A2W2AFR0_9BACT|nr:sialate O-acetylesterase [Taibaiella soli]PZF71050.1 sialate O-acetylesterase [Taibaiella soli]
MIHSFLMIGQSNMAGRGYLKDVPPILNESVKTLRNGRWQIMSEPINYDRPTAGVGLAASFAAAYSLKQKVAEIGLIPCADGGTSLEDWSAGNALFDHAVAQAKLAQRSSNLTGILWHQGESDCFPERAAVYQEKLGAIIKQLRLELAVPDIPLIVGGLGSFLTAGMYGKYFSSYTAVNEALLQFAKTQPDTYFVTADGLNANQDQLHFDAVSQRILGIRYFEAFHNRQHIITPLTYEQEILNTIYNRAQTLKEKTILLEHRFASGSITQDEFVAELAAIQQ